MILAPWSRWSRLKHSEDTDSEKHRHTPRQRRRAKLFTTSCKYGGEKKNNLKEKKRHQPCDSAVTLVFSTALTWLQLLCFPERTVRTLLLLALWTSCVFRCQRDDDTARNCYAVFEQSVTFRGFQMEPLLSDAPLVTQWWSCSGYCARSAKSPCSLLQLICPPWYNALLQQVSGHIIQSFCFFLHCEEASCTCCPCQPLASGRILDAKNVNTSLLSKKWTNCAIMLLCPSLVIN